MAAARSAAAIAFPGAESTGAASAIGRSRGALARGERVALRGLRVQPAGGGGVIGRKHRVAIGDLALPSRLGARGGAFAGGRGPVAHLGAVRPIHPVAPSLADRGYGRSVEAG